MNIIRLQALVFVFLLSSTLTFSQSPINITINNVEYLKFELDDGLGNNKQPIANGSYNIEINDKIYDLTLKSRIQLTDREISYSSIEGRNINPWMLFEFRDDNNVCFIMCQRKNGKYIVADKVLTNKIPGIQRYGIFISCEFDMKEDAQIFGLYTFEGDFQKPQYFTQINKAWQADVKSGKIIEMDESQVRCLNPYYWDYMHDDETIPKWYYSGIVGVINDPDGYTNVRSRPNSNSEIIYRIEEGVEFKFWKDENYDWWKVHITTDDGKRAVNGFMHKSRIIEK